MKLCGDKESRNDSEWETAIAEVELSEAKKLVEELTLLKEKPLKLQENGNYVEVMRDLEVVKEELSRLKVDVSSIFVERTAASKEFEELRFKTEGNLRLLESLEKEIEVANEEHMLVEFRKLEILMDYEEIERQRERRGKEFLDLLVTKKKIIKEMLEDVEKSKDIESKLSEASSDIEMLESQLKLVKKMERRDTKMARSNHSFERGKYNLSVLIEETEAKKEELALIKAELFKLMTVMDALRNEVIQTKEETAYLNKVLQKVDGKIQKLNSKMLMEKSKLEVTLTAKERVSSLVDNLAGSFDKLKKNRKAAKKEERLLKVEKMVTMAETQKTELKIDEKERELISKLDELKKAKEAEALVLEKLESFIENTMENRVMESENCSTITISRFEYEYLSRHTSQAEERADKKVAATEAWVEAVKASTKVVLMKIETLMRESGMTRVEEEKEVLRTERSLSEKRLVEEEIQKFKQNPETKSYLSPPKPVGKSERLSKKIKPVQRGKPRRYPFAGTPTFFVVKKKKKVPNLAKFFSRRR